MLINRANELQSPCYIFDNDVLIKQITKIKTILPDNIKICYALKANPFIVGAVNEYIDYFEACSYGEFKICELNNIDPSKIIMSGVYKDANDVLYSLDKYKNKIEYTIESYQQWLIIYNYVIEKKLKIKVLLRLTNGNQFGMDQKTINQIINESKDNDYISILGIQYFSGTQKKSKTKHINELSMLKDYLSYLKETHQVEINRIEYGPGLPVTYFKEEKDIEDTYLQLLNEALISLEFDGEIVLEMGRIIAANCGDYLTKIVDIKHNDEKSYCIVDGGIHQINYYGSMMAMKTPYVEHISNNSGQTGNYTVCGCLCTMNDVLLKQYPFMNISVNDYLLFKKVGAYSMCEGISLFLSHDLVSIYIKEKDNYTLIRDSYPTYKLNSKY